MLEPKSLIGKSLNEAIQEAKNFHQEYQIIRENKKNLLTNDYNQNRIIIYIGEDNVVKSVEIG